MSAVCLNIKTKKFHVSFLDLRIEIFRLVHIFFVQSEYNFSFLLIFKIIYVYIFFNFISYYIFFIK